MGGGGVFVGVVVWDRGVGESLPVERVAREDVDDVVLFVVFIWCVAVLNLRPHCEKVLPNTSPISLALLPKSLVLSSFDGEVGDAAPKVSVIG